MKRVSRLSLLGIAVLVASMGVSVALAGEPPRGAKVIKELPTIGAIEGAFVRLPPGRPVDLQVLRLQDHHLVPVTTVHTDGTGQFEVPALDAGDYVLTPDLASLPEGVGLHERHAFVHVEQDPVAVSFHAAPISKLTLPETPIRPAADGLLAIETAAFDSAGQYLFARSEIEIPAGATEVGRSEHGKRVRVAEGTRSLEVHAHNGQISATATIPLVGQ